MTAPSPRFYVQLPADEFGNVGYTKAVIEATKEDLGDERFRLRITAPATYQWPTIIFYGDGYGRWVETEGPARFLSREEWLSLIALHGWKVEQVM